MAMARTARLSRWLLATPLVATATHALFVGGGLTILSKNELDAARSNGTAAILVHQPSPFIAASTSCTLLGETPWNPDTASFATELAAALPYQSYAGIFPADQQYWIARAAPFDTTCRSISATGRVSPAADCLAELPVLCTQSAPLSNTTFADNGPAWQVTQAANQTLLTGYRDTHTWKFRGVRFAAPPKRFAYSKGALLEEGDVQAVTPGADCVQPIGEVKNGSSEDCLFMNIWTTHLPRMAGAKKEELRPVMVYLYGGGFTSGSGKNPNTDGTNLASRGDVVAVSVNYRVGNVGFLAFDDGVHKGNYALSDMVTALEWVQKYIRYFGGDAERVTLFGESAGAQATHILLGSPKAKGLFHRAIMQSDPQGYPKNGKFSWMSYDPVQTAYQSSTMRVLNLTGCLNATDQVDCVSKVDAFKLVNLTTNFNGAVMDGTYLDQPHLVVNATGIASNISIITGINRDEAGVLVDNKPDNTTTTFAAYAAKALARYNLDPDFIPSLAPSAFSATANTSIPTPDLIFNETLALSTDGEFGCFDAAKALSGATHGAFKAAYLYTFNRTYQTAGYTRPWCVPPATPAHPAGDPDGEYFKCHAGEQLVVFGNARRAGLPDRDGRDVPFMQVVVDYWAAFARTGDPNPDMRFLAVRGHVNTLQQMQRTGRWEGVGADRQMRKLLQWDGGMVALGEAERCRALGIPLDVLEK